MLQLLQLLAMEPPRSIDPAEVTQAKIAVLHAMKFTDGLLGQYNGYQKVGGSPSQLYN